MYSILNFPHTHKYFVSMQLLTEMNKSDLVTRIIRVEVYKGDWLEESEAERKEAEDTEMGKNN